MKTPVKEEVKVQKEIMALGQITIMEGDDTGAMEEALDGVVDVAVRQISHLLEEVDTAEEVEGRLVQVDAKEELTVTIEVGEESFGHGEVG